MQLKRVLVSVIASLSLFSATANANVKIFSSSSSQNLCTDIQGQWIGNGTVTARFMGVKIRCDYAGDTYITGAEDFSADIHLHLTSGICPAAEDFIMPGICNGNTGMISLESDEANLSGTLSNDGKQVNFTGTVNIPMGGTTVVGTVERMELHKV